MTEHTRGVLDEVERERDAQDRKWGGRDHDDRHTVPAWIGLFEERVEKIEDARKNRQNARAVRREALVLAALAVAFVESLDREAWRGVDLSEGDER